MLNQSENQYDSELDNEQKGKRDFIVNDMESSKSNESCLLGLALVWQQKGEKRKNRFRRKREQ